MSRDLILIENFEISCRIGITVEEQAFPQILKLDLRIETPLETAGRSDKLSDTIDYAQIIFDVRTIGSQRMYNLVESLAESIAAHILKITSVRGVTVSLRKKVFADVQSVGVSIYRTKASLSPNV